jgi:dTMP kinase
VDRGRLIAFEGVDGSGKSTQARRLADLLGALYTIEPGGSELGRSLRELVLDASVDMAPETEALVMLADRSHHVATVIEPALADGRDVVTDRFIASTLAYQGFGRGVDLELLLRATELAIGSCRAEVTVLIDIPVPVARQRSSPDRADRFEGAGEEFQEAVRQGFLELSRAAYGNWLVVDGTGTVEDVAMEIDEGLVELGLRRRA